MQAPGQVQRGSGEGSEGSGEGLGAGLGGFGAEPGQVQQGSGEGSGEGLDKVPEKVLEIFGAGPGQVQRVPEIRRFRRRLQIRFRRNLFFFFLFSCVCTLRTCKNKTLRLLGIPPKLIFLVSQLALKFPQDE